MIICELADSPVYMRTENMKYDRTQDLALPYHNPATHQYDDSGCGGLMTVAISSSPSSS